MKTQIQILLATGFIFMGCQNKMESEVQVENLSSQQPSDVGTNPEVKKLAIDINKFPMTKTVCDPFTNGVSNKITLGLKAQLVYKTSDMLVKGNLADVFSTYKPSEKTLFFSNINVPTRPFSSGFLTEAGETLKTDTGEMLVENFGIKYTSFLALSDVDEEGLYDIATLSDDGTIVKIGRGPAQETLINNDGNHPTRMGCSSRLVEMKRGQKIPIEIQWYQGPRYHIANVLMWKKVDAGAAKDSACGKVGNDYFFSNGVPQAPYNNLLARNWKVIAKENFILDEQSLDYNPCVSGQLPVISEFYLMEATLTQAWFSWRTDIPSTSQVLITDLSTGEVAITNSDNILRTQHEIKVLNLKPMTDYKAQVVSISETLGRTLGPVVTFTTP